MKSTIFPFFLAVLFAYGCAHSRNRELEAKASAESTVSTPSELDSEVAVLIEKDAGLSAEQKARLKELHASHKAKVEAIDKQSLELKQLLVKDILAPGYNGGEVKDIKRRLRQIEDKRLSALFDAVDKANGILGRDSARRPEMMRAFLGTGAKAYRE